MERFELVIQPSTIALRLFWFLLCFVVVVLCASASNLLSALIVAVICALLVVWGIGFQRQILSTSGRIVVGYDNRVTLLLPGDTPLSVSLTDRCLVNDWCCRVALCSAEDKRDLPKNWRQPWIWRDSLSDTDYRRLCRVLLYQRHTNTTHGKSSQT
ncbi:protein YgfX [Corallincola luteus]|uniref:protein YgfX n=1 Tax=Corallincola luteus TaxID=1775177 RepID=UPI0030B84876